MAKIPARAKSLTIVVAAATVAALLVVLPGGAGATAAPFESGTAAITDDWMTVAITGSFIDPVVVAGPATETDTDPGVVEVANVTTTTFDIRFREWAYLDGTHASESVHYLIAERGVTTLPSGGRFEAGSTMLGKSYTRVHFSSGFSGGHPAVFSTTPVRRWRRV